jgi:ABC-type polysaccharide/polyol phosphate transport system ATPase subunit
LPKGRVEAVHVWKRFRADRSRSQLGDQFQNLAGRLHGRESTRWRWALRDVDLVAEPGEAVALLGVNGSGKSTFLKILCRVMYPHTGRVAVDGRVGALIEVQAGIHPDLTGRENVYVYGSLLGLPRRDVARRFDDIVEFAELSNAIDRQVKFYSSGMRMRLGFAVAAFLEPDILLVDEVLAVGDAAFQQRCLDRLRAVLDQGTTLVFVSHDLAAVEATCARGVYLSSGTVVHDGPIRDVLASYRRAVEEMAVRSTKEHAVEVSAHLVGEDGGSSYFHTQRPMTVELTINSPEAYSGELFLGVTEGTPTPIFLLKREANLAAGLTSMQCRLPRLPLPRGRYFLWVALYRHEKVGGDLVEWQPLVPFDVAGPWLDRAPTGVVRLAPFHVDSEWS